MFDKQLYNKISMKVASSEHFKCPRLPLETCIWPVPLLFSSLILSPICCPHEIVLATKEALHTQKAADDIQE